MIFYLKFFTIYFFDVSAFISYDTWAEHQLNKSQNNAAISIDHLC